MVKVIFHTLKEQLLKERIRFPWEQILSFKRSSHFEKGPSVENRCLIKSSPFDVRNFFSVLATPVCVTTQELESKPSSFGTEGVTGLYYHG